MKKTLYSVSLLLFLLPVKLLAEADGPDFWDVTNVQADDVLNIRQSPSAKSDKSGAFSPHQTCIKNLGCRGILSLKEYMALSSHEKQQQKNKHHWCQVQQGNKKGWVLNKYLKESSQDCQAGTDSAIVKHVQFPKGEIGTIIKDHISGYQYIDYKLNARAGQGMIVSLQTDNLSNYFNVLAPGETDVAFFVGSSTGNRFEGDLPISGDYTIRVYLMRNAARRNENAHYTLEIAIAEAGDVPSEANDNKPEHRHANQTNNDATVANTQFNATGNIPCSRYKGQPMISCKFGVIRQENGNATVRVFWPNGGERNLYFKNGKASSSDSGANISTERESDLNKIIDGTTERFEIPDAVIYGG